MAKRLVRTPSATLRIFKEIRRDNTKLFVKKISWVTGASELTNHFSQFGRIRNITLPFDLRTGLHKGFAFISFESNDFYENIKKFEGKHIIDDEEVICSLASEEKSISSDNANSAVFDSDNSETNVSKRISSNEFQPVKSLRTENNIEYRSSVAFQDLKKRAKKINLLHKLQQNVDPKRTSKKNQISEEVINAKFADLLTGNQNGNQFMRSPSDSYVMVRKNDSINQIGSKEKSWSSTGTAKRSSLGKASNSSN